MRVPSTINLDTLNCYSNQLNFRPELPLRLSELCIKVISVNLTQKTFNKLICSDKCLLLEYFSTDAPLEITVPLIDNDVYWKKCYKAKWPNKEPCRKLEHLITYSDNDYVYPSWLVTSTMGRLNPLLSISDVESSTGSLHYNDTVGKLSERSLVCEVSQNSHSQLKSWRTCYLEAYLQQYIEELTPEKYDPEEICKISKLTHNYIITLHLEQMKISPQTLNHIQLNALISVLDNLTEFSITYGERNIGTNFSFSKFELSLHDCIQLGKCVGKSNIKIYRVERSNLNCEKLIGMLENLENNRKLQVLDFSHCRIGDKGAEALAKFSLTQSKLHTIVLTNNKITSIGAHFFANILQQNCKLQRLYLNLNSIDLTGGNSIIKSLKSNQFLKYLNLSACSIGSNLQITEMLQQNETLQNLDLSNNSLSEETGNSILMGLEDNFQIETIDLRLCLIPFDLQIQIQKLLSRNSRRKHTEMTQGRFRFKSDQEVAHVINNLHLKKWVKIATGYKVKSVVALKTPKCSISGGEMDIKLELARKNLPIN